MTVALGVQRSESAEIRRRGLRRVGEVLRVGHALAVSAPAHVGPGGGQELHWPDGPVEDRVGVQPALVGVGDPRHAGL